MLPGLDYKDDVYPRVASLSDDGLVARIRLLVRVLVDLDDILRVLDDVLLVHVVVR